MKINKIDCDIAQDLFPNYIEDLCNESTKEAVKNHLAECTDCKQVLEDYVGDIEGKKTEESEADLNLKEEMSKKIVAKIATKKFLTIGILVFLLFGTGAYRAIYDRGSLLSLSPESAFRKESFISQNAEIIDKVKTDKEVFIIYEDGTKFGVARAYKFRRLFWNSAASGYGNELLIGNPYVVAGNYRNNDGIWTFFRAVKTNDSNIQYVVFDKAEIPFEGDLKLHEAQMDDRFLLIEITEGYGYVIDTVIYHEYTSHYVDIGYFTKDAVYKSKHEYRLIRGERFD